LYSDDIAQFKLDAHDIWHISPDDAARLIDFTAEEQNALWARLHEYPHRGKGEDIVPLEPQWVDGANEALEFYRQRTRTKRDKMWCQTDDPLTNGFLVYHYPYHQELVVPATFDIAKEPLLQRLTEKVNNFYRKLGAQNANHLIATSYVDGDDHIGLHSDDSSTLAASSEAAGLSLITVLKFGPSSRPFVISETREGQPFFNKVLSPGTVMVMTMEANNSTFHAVPATAGIGASGSIVFRTCIKRVPIGQQLVEIQARAVGGAKQGLRQDAAEAYGRMAVALGGLIQSSSNFGGKHSTHIEPVHQATLSLPVLFVCVRRH
jgi:alkylated DNA repair dioxygenase AlkB